jgi:CheY-like chemotaxis protein
MMQKVLVVEDEQLVSRMFEKTLAGEGFEVKVAGNGEDGIKIMKSWKPDVVLMDVMMPKMNGIQALDLIKNDAEINKIPVVMLTNLSGKHDAELAENKGALEYWVKKDAKPGEFGSKIKSLLEKVKK